MNQEVETFTKTGKVTERNKKEGVDRNERNAYKDIEIKREKDKKEIRWWKLKKLKKHIRRQRNKERETRKKEMMKMKETYAQTEKERERNKKERDDYNVVTNWILK